MADTDSMAAPKFFFENTFHTLESELKMALAIYWETAKKVLPSGAVKVLDPESDYYSMKRNFFSALFLYSYFRGGIKKSDRIFYAAANQCLRGMVTGCDNILDDEYKMTLNTNLPQNAGKFRSIIDIMVSDRVLISILQERFLANDLTSDQVLSAAYESLRTLTKSGAQEASEESGAGQILPPDTILESIHPLKTGVLFQSPWALPNLLEHSKDMNDDLMRLRKDIQQSLFDIGMGCQILDDMVDLDLDIRMNRHNYVVALIKHSNIKEEAELFCQSLSQKGPERSSKDWLTRCDCARKTAAQKAMHYLVSGTRTLFAPDHQFMVEISIKFIAETIGAAPFLDLEQCHWELDP